MLLYPGKKFRFIFYGTQKVFYQRLEKMFGSNINLIQRKFNKKDPRKTDKYFGYIEREKFTVDAETALGNYSNVLLEGIIEDHHDHLAIRIRVKASWVMAAHTFGLMVLLFALVFVLSGLGSRVPGLSAITDLEYRLYILAAFVSIYFSYKVFERTAIRMLNDFIRFTGIEWQS
ncbi:MAG: hypothetical protein RQ866_04390 [Bacteroidales bacterium]|nr:hypothetical protein [Bacteroidales bacterium]